ncbi:hypothetical protein [Clostridium algidicarnis]|uniref:hypothetical protein n=1 Tax=Clostridium algidicarnis TaxID=37659 RepID=UPI001C0C06F8|nr:hypothetical protein [Clostridium algidicarnis]MBU3227359.1 hypothetical protein [Clostridium algidicarnis]MBU3251233.1 hypothetical protein [Clostridium algidicarnis]
MDIKNELKNNREVLEKVLTYYGATIKIKGNCDCVPNRHKDPKNNLSIKYMDGYVCCCHCGLQGDVFNIINKIEGIRSFPGQLKRVCEIINVNYYKEYEAIKATNNEMKCRKKVIKQKFDFTEIANDLYMNSDKTDLVKQNCNTKFN